MTTPAPQPQQDKDLDIIRDYIIMSSDWEIQQEMALDALHRIRSRLTPTPQKSVSLTAIEIALRKEENPSEYVQWAIEHLNRYQEQEAQARNATLDAIIEFTKGNSETIEADDGSLEDAVFLGELLDKINSLRGEP
jgi:histidinol-phosphate/aromatic aminotransferase/cobyric acid decarboxylase-like protein